MKSANILTKLKAAGWFEVPAKGGHRQLKHPTRPGRVTVPHPRGHIPVGTRKSIEKQSGVKLE